MSTSTVNSRNRILDSASSLMSRNGYMGSAISAISKDSGLPPSSIYHFFGSKAGLLAAVMERGATQFYDDMAKRLDVLDLHDVSLEYAMRRVLGEAADVFYEHTEFMRILLELLLTENESGDAENGSGNAPMQASARVLARGRILMMRKIRDAFGVMTNDANADMIAKDMTDFAMASFAGAFVLTSNRSEAAFRLMIDQLADAITARGRAMIMGINQ